MMTTAERETVLKNLVESRERLLRTAQGLSREQLHYRPAPGRWTVAENIEHLTFVEGRVLALIQKSLSEGPAPNKRSAFEGKDTAMVADVAGRVTRFQAPEYIQPNGRWPDDQLLKEFEAARQQTREFASSTGADLRAHFYTHPVFGDLDLYQWLLLIGAHCDRHRTQSEEVMASAGFPRSSAAAS
ncbi:MAG TPA: DinB family protein [Candidatus Acidoferrum sp.]|nr:DinB family protein [Candidatus Acidoferrum sp.]